MVFYAPPYASEAEHEGYLRCGEAWWVSGDRARLYSLWYRNHMERNRMDEDKGIWISDPDKRIQELELEVARLNGALNAALARKEALGMAMRMHGEYTKDPEVVVKAAQQFEAYLKGEVSLEPTKGFRD